MKASGRCRRDAFTVLLALLTSGELSLAQSGQDEGPPESPEEGASPSAEDVEPGEPVGLEEGKSGATDPQATEPETHSPSEGDDEESSDENTAERTQAEGPQSEEPPAATAPTTPREPAPPRREVAKMPLPGEGDSDSKDPQNGSRRGGHFEFTPGGYFQARLERTSFEHLGFAEPDAGEIHPSHFQTDLTLPRAALYVEGSAHSPALTYRLQVGLDPKLDLEDLYVNYAFFPALQLRVGKDKRPFSREFLTRRNHLQFSDLSPVERYFGIDRDIGVLLHNDYLNTTGFEYALGVYRGEHVESYDSTSFRYVEPLVDNDEPLIVPRVADETADTIEPTLVFRIGYNNGPDSYRQSAWGRREYQYGVALSGLLDLNTNRSGASRAQVEIDAIFKVGGFAISHMIAMKLQQTGDDFIKNRDQGGAATSLQMGYVFAQRVEPLIRLSAAMVGEANYDAIAHLESESAVGFNVYFFGQDLKWTNEFSLTRWAEAVGQPEDIVIRRTWMRSQLQFGFRGL